MISTKNIKSNLKFLTEIVLFYPVILQAISDISKNSDEYGLILKWGVVVFSLIISYLFIDKFNDVAKDWAKRLTSIFIIVSILSFAIQFYLLALIQGMDNVSYTIAFALGLSMISTVSFPIIVLILIIGYLTIRYLVNSFK